MRQAWVRGSKHDKKVAAGWVVAVPRQVRHSLALDEFETLMEISDIGYARDMVEAEGPYWREFDSAAWTGRPDLKVAATLRLSGYQPTVTKEQYRAAGWLT